MATGEPAWSNFTGLPDVVEVEPLVPCRRSLRVATAAPSASTSPPRDTQSNKLDVNDSSIRLEHAEAGPQAPRNAPPPRNS